MAKLPFLTFALKCESWVTSQAPGALASTALDVEGFILEAVLTVGQVHVWAHQSGFPGLLHVLGLFTEYM